MMPASDTNLDATEATIPESVENTDEAAQDWADEDVEELEFLIDDIEDQIAPLAL